jgi:3-hydroxyethyl bacteriochlorophyllide a dehydrogenase
MQTIAVVLESPGHLVMNELDLTSPSENDVVVDIEFSGISTGTERLLWSGRMPPFPGMGYPLVPGYESVGTICDAGDRNISRIGQTVFVPGANCFGAVRGLFGGAAAKLVVPAARVVEIDSTLGEQGVLMALAATAFHCTAPPHTDQPELIVGHGVLGRLLARLVVQAGGPPPTVWETNPERAAGAVGYEVVHPDSDPKRDYRVICDVSGDASLLDSLIGRIALGGEIILAGFYSESLSFSFPPAFRREARIRIAAEFRPSDIAAVLRLIEDGSLSLDGLITHRQEARAAEAAYRTAFTDPACLKMVLDWRACA